MLALHMFSSRRPRLCARLATAPSSQRPPTRPSSTRSGPSTNSTQPARASHFEQRGRRPACTGVPRRRPCRRGIGAHGRRLPPVPPRARAPRHAATRAMLTSRTRPPRRRVLLEAGARAPASPLCAPDGTILLTFDGQKNELETCARRPLTPPSHHTPPPCAAPPARHPRAYAARRASRRRSGGAFCA